MLTVGKRSRYVLCRPDGGLNDTLTQIAVAHNYAKRTNRIAIIDTGYEKSLHFHDKFSNYFVSSDSRLVLNPDSVMDCLASADVMPRELKGRLTSYRPQWSEDVKNFVDSETGVGLSFDPTKEYDEDIVLLHSCGGNILGVTALKNLVIHDRMISILERRIDVIGRPFSAIHIRNTDYQTDYVQTINDLKGNILLPVFIATDSSRCREYCKKVFGGENVVYFSRLPGDEMPIHSNRKFLTPFERNSDAILDLITLALSNEYYKIPLKIGSAIKYSYYSNLAEQLVINSGILISVLGQSTSAKAIIEKVVAWQSNSR